MPDDYVQVKVRALMPTRAGCAVFLRAGKKTVLFFVDAVIGVALNASLTNRALVRPSTHELMRDILSGYEITMDHAVIVDQRDEVLLATMRMTMTNELHQYKILEVDARPGDAICMAVEVGAPIYMVKSLWERMENVANLLKDLIAHAPENYGPELFD